jgi:hypothetical protein
MKLTLSTISGIAALSLGLLLLLFAYLSSTESLNEVADGRYADPIMGYLIAGILASGVGVGLLLVGHRKVETKS